MPNINIKNVCFIKVNKIIIIKFIHNQLIKKLIIKINLQKYNWNANSILNIVYRQIENNWYTNWEYNPNVNQLLI